MVRLAIVPVLLIWALSSCAPVAVPVADCQTRLAEFSALTQDLEFPVHLQEQDAQKNGSEFDVNDYFTVLPHLSLEDGYVLDYVYFYDGFASWPVLYSRHREDEAYATYSAYEQERESEESQYAFMDNVKTDASAEGYFEWVLLANQGAQFYLGWHANYSDRTIVCSREGVARVIGQANDFGTEMTPEQVQMAYELDVAPSVVFDGDVARVRLVTFTKWGGFFEEVTILSTDPPHRLLEHTSRELVPYDSHVVF